MLTIRHNRMTTPSRSLKTTEAEEFLAQPIRKPKIKIVNGSIGQVLRDICANYGTTPSEVLSGSRVRNILKARNEFIQVMHFKHMYSCSQLAHMMNMDLTSVKHIVGLRDRSPVPYEVLRKKYS